MNATMEAVSNKDFTAMSETQSPAHRSQVDPSLAMKSIHGGFIKKKQPRYPRTSISSPYISGQPILRNTT